MWRAQPGQRDSPEHAPALDVDRDDAASTRVGDERVPAVGMGGRVARLLETAQHVPHAVPVDDRDGADRGVADDGTLPDQLDRPRIGRASRCAGRRANAPQVDDGEPRLGVARDERRRARRGRALGAASSGAPAASTTNSRRFTSRLRARATARGPAVRFDAVSHPELAERAGLRRPRLRAARADARRRRRRGRPRRRRGRAGGDGRLGGEAPADLRGRRARALLRPPRLRGDRRAASTSAVAGCTTRSAASSWSTGRRRQRGRSTPRRRRTRTASRCAAGSAPTAGGSSTSPTSRSTARSSTAPPSATSCSKSSSAGASGTCATSSRRSRPTSTA